MWPRSRPISRSASACRRVSATTQNQPLSALLFLYGSALLAALTGAIVVMPAAEHVSVRATNTHLGGER